MVMQLASRLTHSRERIITLNHHTHTHTHPFTLILLFVCCEFKWCLRYLVQMRSEHTHGKARMWDLCSCLAVVFRPL